jgi:uncharacterized protein YecA (UPF0149 family)
MNYLRVLFIFVGTLVLWKRNNMDTNNRKIAELNDIVEQELGNYTEFKRTLSEGEKIRQRVSRNAKCPCNSGKKVKHCCLKKK